MKRMLFLMSMLCFCVTGITAQQVVETKEKTIEEEWFQKAVDAIKESRFIIKFHAEDSGSKRRVSIDNRVNFLIVDGEYVAWQTARDRDIDFREINVHSGSQGLVGLKMNESKLSNMEVKNKKNGDVFCSVSIEGRSIQEAQITLKKGTNDCLVKCKMKGGGMYRIGTLYPIDATTVEKGEPYR